MSAIFLSHSSRDNEIAVRVKAWLETQGHRSVFLDFDPERGIPAGRNWERELYQQLRACRAVIVLCSDSSMNSRWCFAEITHARSLGKHIFPLKVDSCQVDPVLTDLQVLDYTAGAEEALARLGRGLAAAGVDAADPHDWDGSRPPYPGLLAFQEEDAAVYFGREQEIGQALDLLNQMRRYGGAGLLLLLGSSGSGKSSLMRAGMLPRLRRAPEQWRVVDPIRPGDDPAGRLASALARAAGHPEGWREIRDTLTLGGERKDPGEALVEQVRDLQRASGHDDATVLLFVDQFEELLGQPPEHPGNRFLQQVAAALDAGRAPLLVVATLRSDFLATFQQHPALRSLPFRSLSLGPIAPERQREIIEKPAALAGIDLEPALVQALLLDTEAEDALPLLAFTLRELWELSREDRTALELSDYRDRLGGLRGSLARSAESVLASRTLTREEEDGLRGAFLGMVRVGEDGNFARRAIGWEQLSEAAHAWLERFVQARLLVSRGDRDDRTLEVAHEVLFRAWERLAAWIDENREALLLRHELTHASKLWERGERSSEDLWRGGRLHRALEIRDRAFVRRRDPRDGRERREATKAIGGRLPVTDGELDFLEAAEAAERHQEQRKRRRRWAVIGASLVIAAIGFSLYLWAVWEQRQTEIQASRVLAQQAYTLRERLDLALLLAVEASLTADTREARTTLMSLIAARPRLETILDQQLARIHALAIHPEADLLAAAGDEGVVRVFDLTTRRERDLAEDVRTFDLAFSPDGERLAAVGTADDSVRLWNVRTGDLWRILEGSACPPPAEASPAQPSTVPNTVYGVAFNPRERTLATVDHRGRVRLWDEPTGSCLAQERGHAGPGNHVAFDPQGRLLASSGNDGVIQLWDVTDGLARRARLEATDTGSVARVMAVAFSGDGRLLASASTDGRIRLWDLETSPITARVFEQSDGGSVETLAFHPDGTVLASAGESGVVHLWDPATGDLRLRIRAHDSVVTKVVLGPDGFLATAGGDATVRLWSTAGSEESGIEMLEARAPSRVALDPGGRFVVSADRVSIQAWDMDTGDPRFSPAPSVESNVVSLEVDPEGGLIAAGTQNGRVWLWNAATGEEKPIAQVDTGLNPAWSLAFHRDGEWLATGSANAQVSLRALDGDPSAARTVTLRPGRIPTGQARALSLAFDPEGRRLAAGIGNTVQLWDLSACSEALEKGCGGDAVVIESEETKGELFRLAFAADGRTLFAGTSIGTVLRWRLEPGEPPDARPTLGTHEGLVQALLLDQEGRFLVSAATDHRIILWNLETGRGELDFLGHENAIQALAYRDERLLSASRDGTVRVWQASRTTNLATLQERACRIAHRNLRLAEWNDFIGPAEDHRPTCPTPWAADEGPGDDIH